MTTSDRNSNHLVVPNHCCCIIVYSNQFPPCLFEQVTEIGERAFLAIKKTHHLGWKRKIKSAYHLIGASFHFLTSMSTRYTIEPARPKLRSRGWGGAESSAPWISRAAGSSQTVEYTCSTRTSWVFCPAAARRCFSMVRQYSSDQSCSTLETRKTETSSCRAGCGVKKSWPWELKY